MIELATFELRTLSGEPVGIVLSMLGETDARLHTLASVGGKSGQIANNQAYAVPTEPPKPGYWYEGLAKVGASHYAKVDGIGMLALDRAQADLLNTACEDAAAKAEKILADRHAAQTAARRQRAERRVRGVLERTETQVRRVLRHSPNWEGYALDEVCQPAEPPAGLRPEYRATVRLGIPGLPAITVHPRCPSLAAVVARSPYEGFVMGHENTLLAISDADWDLLARETAELEAGDAARVAEREAADRAEYARLRAVEVPAGALEVFARYGGDQERAWEAEDERAWHQIRRYGAAIEAQGLGLRAPAPLVAPSDSLGVHGRAPNRAGG